MDLKGPKMDLNGQKMYTKWIKRQIKIEQDGQKWGETLTKKLTKNIPNRPKN